MKCRRGRGAESPGRQARPSQRLFVSRLGLVVGQCFSSRATSPDAPGRPYWTGSLQVVSVGEPLSGLPVEGIGDACKGLGQGGHITVIQPLGFERATPDAGSHRMRFAMVYWVSARGVTSSV